MHNIIFYELPTGKGGIANYCHSASDDDEKKADPEDPEEWENNQTNARRVLQRQEISRKAAERQRYRVIYSYITPTYYTVLHLNNVMHNDTQI